MKIKFLFFILVFVFPLFFVEAGGPRLVDENKLLEKADSFFIAEIKEIFLHKYECSRSHEYIFEIKDVLFGSVPKFFKDTKFSFYIPYFIFSEKCTIPSYLKNPSASSDNLQKGKKILILADFSNFKKNSTYEVLATYDLEQQKRILDLLKNLK